MTTKVSQVLLELADREAIKECLYRYARGADRLDADMVRSAYWPDVTDTHLTFTGNCEEFIDWSFAAMKTMDQTQHMVSNVLIAIEGDFADVESYFYGFQRINGSDGSKFDVIAGGRYLDRMEKRDDEWRIVQRLVVTDWFRQYPDSADWSTGMMGMMIEPGGRHPDDESYKRLNLR